MLDAVDIKILSILQKDCTVSVADIGKEVGPVSYTHLTLPTIYSV